MKNQTENMKFLLWIKRILIDIPMIISIVLSLLDIFKIYKSWDSPNLISLYAFLIGPTFVLIVSKILESNFKKYVKENNNK